MGRFRNYDVLHTNKEMDSFIARQNMFASRTSLRTVAPMLYFFDDRQPGAGNSTLQALSALQTFLYATSGSPDLFVNGPSPPLIMNQRSSIVVSYP